MVTLQPYLNMQCLTPLHLYRKVFQKWIDVPCGKCYFCIANRVNGWQFRLQQEDKISKSSHFVTFTYDTQNLPIATDGELSLDKQDLQLFFKRLRKTQYEKIKYFACGEYGENTERPHYHAILFNVESLLQIEKTWQKGKIHAGTVTPQSIGYTLKYMFKHKLPTFKKRANEFQLMSKGLGASYINEKSSKWHKDNLLERGYSPLLEGNKTTLPRYYKDKIYTPYEKRILNDYFTESHEELTDLEIINKFRYFENKFKTQRLKTTI